MDKLGLSLELLTAVVEPATAGVPLLRHDAKVAAKAAVAGVPLPANGTANLRFPASGVAYSGDVVNGIRHGRGTLLLDDGTRYQGTFEQGKLHGQGVISYADGSEYRGDIYYGVRHGNGTFTYAGGAATYVGEWRNGLRHGTGTLWYGPARDASASYYRGQWVSDKRHGRGLLRYASGNSYVGQWAADAKCGLGRMTWRDRAEEYVGYWLADAPHGYGVHSWYVPTSGAGSTAGFGSTGAASPTNAGSLVLSQASPGGTTTERSGGTAGTPTPTPGTSPFPGCVLANRYKGTYIRGYRFGMGVFSYSNGARYVGEWHADFKHGHGVYSAPDGSVFDGLFIEDRAWASSSSAQAVAAVASAAGPGAVAGIASGRTGSAATTGQRGGVGPQAASANPAAALILQSLEDGFAATAASANGEGAGWASSSAAAAAAHANAHAHTTPSSTGRAAGGMMSGPLPLPLPLALPDPTAVNLAALSAGGSSSPGSGTHTAVEWDPLFTLHVHELLPAAPALLQWFVSAYPGRAGEVTGLQPGTIDPVKADAVASRLRARSLQGLQHVLLRWNTRLTGWYQAYSRLGAAGTGPAPGPSSAWAGGEGGADPLAIALSGALSSPALAVPGSTAALTEPGALLRQLQALRNSMEVGCASNSPVMTLSHLWRFVTDIGALCPPDVTLATVCELLLTVRRRQSKAVVEAAVRLASVAVTFAARAAAQAQEHEVGNTHGNHGSTQQSSHGHGHREEKKGDSEGEGEEASRHGHHQQAGYGASSAPAPASEPRAYLANGLPLPPETAEALGFILSHEASALADAHRNRFDPDCPVLFREFVEVIVRLAHARHSASAGQIRPPAPTGTAAAGSTTGSMAEQGAGSPSVESPRPGGAGAAVGFAPETTAGTLNSTTTSGFGLQVQGGGTGSQPGSPRSPRAISGDLSRRRAIKAGGPSTATASNSLLATSQGPDAMVGRLAVTGVSGAAGPGNPLTVRPGSPGATQRLTLAASAAALGSDAAGSGVGGTTGSGLTGILALHPGLVGGSSTLGGGFATTTVGTSATATTTSGGGLAVPEGHPDALPFIVESFLWFFVSPRAISPASATAMPLNLLPPAPKGKRGPRRGPGPAPPPTIPPPPPQPQPLAEEDGYRAAVQAGTALNAAGAVGAASGAAGVAGTASLNSGSMISEGSSIGSLQAAGGAITAGPAGTAPAPGAIIAGLLSSPASAKVLDAAFRRLQEPAPVAAAGETIDVLAYTAPEALGSTLGPVLAASLENGAAGVDGAGSRGRGKARASPAAGLGLTGQQALIRERSRSPSPDSASSASSTPRAGAHGNGSGIATDTSPWAAAVQEALSDPANALGAELRAVLTMALGAVPLGPVPATAPLHAIRGPAPAKHSVAAGHEEEGKHAEGHETLLLSAIPDVPGTAEAAATAGAACTTVTAGAVVAALRAAGLLEEQADEIGDEAALAAVTAAGLDDFAGLGEEKAPVPAPAPAAAPAPAPAKGGKPAPGPAAPAAVTKTPAEIAAEAATDPEKMAAAKLFVQRSSQLSVIAARVGQKLVGLPLFDARAVVEEVWAVLSPVLPGLGAAGAVEVDVDSEEDEEGMGPAAGHSGSTEDKAAAAVPGSDASGASKKAGAASAGPASAAASAPTSGSPTRQHGKGTHGGPSFRPVSALFHDLTRSRPGTAALYGSSSATAAGSAAAGRAGMPDRSIVRLPAPWLAGSAAASVDAGAGALESSRSMGSSGTGISGSGTADPAAGFLPALPPSYPSIPLRLEDALASLRLTKPEFVELSLRLAARYAKTLQARAHAIAPALSAITTAIAPTLRQDLDGEAGRFYKRQAAAGAEKLAADKAKAAAEAAQAQAEAAAVAAAAPGAPAPAAAAAAGAPPASPPKTPSKFRQHSAAIRRMGALSALTSGPGGSVDPGLMALTVLEAEKEAKRSVKIALGRLILLAGSGLGRFPAHVGEAGAEGSVGAYGSRMTTATATIEQLLAPGSLSAVAGGVGAAAVHVAAEASVKSAATGATAATAATATGGAAAAPAADAASTAASTVWTPGQPFPFPVATAPAFIPSHEREAQDGEGQDGAISAAAAAAALVALQQALPIVLGALEPGASGASGSAAR